MQDGNEYLQAIRGALRDNPHAREFYFPRNIARRKAGTLRLGREFGAGLVGLQDGEAIIGSTYSTLVVANCLDQTGVQVNAKEWVGAIQDGMARMWEIQEG